MVWWQSCLNEKGLVVWWSVILFKGERKGGEMFVGSVAQAEMIERITGVGGDVNVI